MNKEWKWLKEIDRNVFKDVIITDCYSVFAENKGIVLVQCDEKVYSIKVAVSAKDSQKLLKIEAPVTIKSRDGFDNITCSTLVHDTRNSFLLTKQGKIFAFQSKSRVYELPNVSDVKFFASFNNKCYVLVEQTGIDCRLFIYPSFGDDCDSSSCEFDLSLMRDPVTVDGSRRSENLCVEMIVGPLSNNDEKFFCELLACDLKEESIIDVLLISIDDKLFWIKYKQNFQKRALDGFVITAITAAKGTIRGMKYADGVLMMLDDSSVLTVYQFCTTLNAITKREILLDGNVKCFRFNGSIFIYSNLEKIIFIDLRNPSASASHIVNLHGITCFSIVTELKIIIAVCRNQMFYSLPLQRPQVKKKLTDFETFSDSDIEQIPCVAKFLEAEERAMMGMEKKIVQAQKLKFLMQHLTTNKGFKAGDATIKLYQNFPSTLPDDAIVCKATDQKLGSGFIEATIRLSKILASLTLSIAFHRLGASGIITRMIKINCAKESVRVVMPDDDATDKMSLDLHLSYTFKGETRLLTFPIDILEIIRCNTPRIKLADDFDKCLDAIRNMKM